jgi:hypothetical protein
LLSGQYLDNPVRVAEEAKFHATGLQQLEEVERTRRVRAAQRGAVENIQGVVEEGDGKDVLVRYVVRREQQELVVDEDGCFENGAVHALSGDATVDEDLGGVSSAREAMGLMVSSFARRMCRLAATRAG